MKKIVLGWGIACGGLGVACYSMCRALAKRVDIEFVLPLPRKNMALIFYENYFRTFPGLKLLPAGGGVSDGCKCTDGWAYRRMARYLWPTKKCLSMLS